MGVKWHISDDGIPRRCQARSPETCRAQGAEHGDSRHEVMRIFEEKMSDQTVASHSRISEETKQHWREEIPVIDRSKMPPHRRGARYAVLSDVDGTLTRGSFVLDHAVFLHDRGIIDVGAEKDAWLNDPKNETAIASLAESYREGLAGKREEDIHVQEFLDGYMKNSSKFYSTLGNLKTFSGCGWEVQLVSGSPSFLINPFARAHGFYGVGSDYKKDSEGRFTGDVDGMFGGPAKRRFVKRLNMGRFRRVIAYGDTASDAPLLDEADYKVVVAPSEETKKMLHYDRVILD